MVAEFMHEASADASTLTVDAGEDKPAATFGDVFHACLSLYHAPADFERDVQLFHRLPEREQVRMGYKRVSCVHKAHKNGVHKPKVSCVPMAHKYCVHKAVYRRLTNAV